MSAIRELSHPKIPDLFSSLEHLYFRTVTTEVNEKDDNSPQPTFAGHQLFSRQCVLAFHSHRVGLPGAPLDRSGIGKVGFILRPLSLCLTDSKLLLVSSHSLSSVS